MATQRMTAEEARQLTDSSKFGLDYVMDCIKTYAKDRKSELRLEIDTLRDVEVIDYDLRLLGYGVNLVGKYMIVQW